MHQVYAASLNGKIALSDGTPVHSGFSVNLIGATSVTKPVGLGGAFTFTDIPAGAYTLRLLLPVTGEAITLNEGTLTSAENLSVGTVTPDGSWLHGQLTRPDGITPIEKNLDFSLVCNSKYVRVNTFNGLAIAKQPANSSCYMDSLADVDSFGEPLLPPERVRFTMPASGTINVGTLRTRQPNLIGRVLDINGLPIPHGAVTLYSFSASGVMGWYKNLMVDKTGTYFTIVKPIQLAIEITAPSQALAGQVPPPFRVTVPANGTLVVPLLQLHTENVSGKLLDRNGSPTTAKGALYFKNASITLNAQVKNGLYHRYLPTGNYQVTAILDNSFSPAAVSVKIMDEVTPTTLDIRAGFAKTVYTKTTNTPNIRVQLKQTNTKTISKETLGLNVHWGMAKEQFDEPYFSFLQTTNTKWVREHFGATNYNGTFVAVPRYDAAVLRYRELGINVVGMLAYNRFQGNTPPDLNWWRKYVRTVVHSYKDHIRVWEIWNEPNYIYLKPPDVAVYLPLLKAASEIIREEDPGAIILNGGLSWPDAKWTEALLKTGRKYIDQFAFHIYYCDQFAKYGDNRMLTRDVGRLKAVLDKYMPGKRAWVTEIGCSLGTKGITEAKQLRYTQQTVPWLLKQGWIEKILWFTIRDPQSGDAYEDQFGLQTKNFNVRSIGLWYASIGTGIPYIPPATPLIKPVTKLIYGKPRLSPYTKEAPKERALRAALKKNYSKAAKNTVATKTWQRLVNAYIYGGYPVSSIARQIQNPKQTIVHPSLPYAKWKK